MAADAHTYLRGIRSLASDYGVRLPEPVRAILDADLQIPTPAQASADAAEALVAALDEPRTYSKTRDRILDDYARVVAAYSQPAAGMPLIGSAERLLTQRRIETVLAHRDELIELFAAAMQPELDELAEIAEAVPFGTKNEHGILPSLAAPVARGEALADRLGRAVTSIAVLWTNSPAPGMARQALVEIPADLGREELFSLKHALAGRREVRSMVSTDAIWWAGPTEFGARFKLVSREAWRDNVRRLDATLKPVVVLEPTRESDAFYTPPARQPARV